MICGLVGRNGWTCASRRTCSRRTPPGWRVGSVYAPKKMKLTWCLLYCVLFLLCAKSLKTGYNIGNKHVYVLCNTKKYLHLGLKINFGMMQRDLFESVYLEIPFLAGWHIAAVRTVPTPETSRNRCAQMLSEIGFLICVRHLLGSTDIYRKSKSYFHKYLFSFKFAHRVLNYHQIISNMGTMVLNW